MPAKLERSQCLAGRDACGQRFAACVAQAPQPAIGGSERDLCSAGRLIRRLVHTMPPTWDALPIAAAVRSANCPPIIADPDGTRRPGRPAVAVGLARAAAFFGTALLSRRAREHRARRAHPAISISPSASPSVSLNQPRSRGCRPRSNACARGLEFSPLRFEEPRPPDHAFAQAVPVRRPSRDHVDVHRQSRVSRCCSRPWIRSS